MDRRGGAWQCCVLRRTALKDEEVSCSGDAGAAPAERTPKPLDTPTTTESVSPPGDAVNELSNALLLPFLPLSLKPLSQLLLQFLLQLNALPFFHPCRFCHRGGLSFPNQSCSGQRPSTDTKELGNCASRAELHRNHPLSTTRNLQTKKLKPGKTVTDESQV